VNITLEDINTPIVSLEENMKKERVRVPIGLMTKGQHRIGIKVSNVTKASYTFNVK
jgi:hypothetical protein